MIIRNFNSLATNRSKKYALSIIEAGLQAAMPGPQLQKIVHRNHLQINDNKIDLTRYRRIFVIAIGKAAVSMTESVNLLTRIDGGLLVTPKKTVADVKKKFKVIRARHPIPDNSSVLAAKKILRFISKARTDDYIIFLISGGASSLVALPDGISLKEKQMVGDLMLRCGANIREINCIRKHLSKIKGGRLLDSMACDSVALVMSDVVRDDLSTIASGMTYFDNTTFRDAKRILKKYNLERKVPKNVLHRINLGVRGKIAETPKTQKIINFVISSNKRCLDAMKRRATELGISTKVASCIAGPVPSAGKRLAKMLTKEDKRCIVFGGETIVNVKGKGMGGRNQELALHIAMNIDLKHQKAIVVSVGTDGVDGNTSYAGAICGSDLKVDKILPFLENNDSFHFFKKYGGLILTGPTQTNLMDIGLILKI